MGVAALGLLAVVLAALVPPAAFAQNLLDFWVPNGPVNATAYDHVRQRLYVGGQFDRIGAPSGAGALVDATSGSVLNPLLRVGTLGAVVRAVVPDGTGGFFFGGEFTQVQGNARQNLAHIDASGNLSSWNPGADGPVHTLAISSGVLYVGGAFGILGSTARTRLGALDASTGALTAWAPTANDTVRFLGVFSGLIYAGGSFTQINGTTRNRVAALTTAGALTSWNPNADGAVRAIYRNGTNIVLGGDFLNVGATSQSRVAVVNATTGAAAPSVISANGPVHTFEADATRLFVGGAFTTIGGASRTGLAAFNLTTHVIDAAWNADLDGPVRDLFLLGSQLYVVGGFETKSGVRRAGAVRVAAASATGGAWDPRTGSMAFCVAASATKAFVGGGFVVVNYENSAPNFHHNLAAYDFSPSSPTFGRPLPISLQATYSPASPSNVAALSYSEPSLLVGGAFNRLNGATRSHAGAFNVDSWSLGLWSDEINGPVTSMAAGFGGQFIAGGYFTSPVLNVGRFEVVGTLAAALPTPSPLNSVLDVEESQDGTLFYAGGFDSPRRRFVMLPYPWTSLASPDPFPIDSISSANFVQIRALEVSTQYVYTGGWFTNYGVRARRNLIDIDRFTGMPSAWAPNPDQPVRSLARGFDRIYIGGEFENIFGLPRQGLASFDFINGRLPTSWNPSISRPFGATFANTIAAASNRVAVGGNFEWANGVYNPYLAVFDDQSPTPVGVGDARPEESLRLAIVPTLVRAAAVISFSLPRTSTPTLDVVDVQGRVVQRVLSGASMTPGIQRIPFDASRLHAGVYLLHLSDGVNTTSTRFVHSR